MSLPSIDESCIAVIGLGYVGLPLALEFSKKNKIKNTSKYRRVIGFDINVKRINELIKGIDSTNEILKKEFINSKGLEFTSNSKEINKADIFLITVPTPITSDKKPELKPLINATKTVAKALTSRSNSCKPIIIYESTVYPGMTEEVCVPILEKISGLLFNKDFFCGYSPERINPGDEIHKLSSIVKITSGSTRQISNWVNNFYASIITAGTYMCSSIKIAEAAKIIENTQRDLNIALINELAIIFNKLDIDTLDVLKAASTKWNFLNFKPGLVGGHCIGVDPYYLTFKSTQEGYYPELVLAGRKINDNMASWIADQIILNMAKKNIEIKEAKVLVMGFTFKENCSDIRNTKVFDLVNYLKRYKLNIEIVDPNVIISEAKNQYNLCVENEFRKQKFDVIILAVAHDYFRNISSEKLKEFCNKKVLIYDLKGVLPKELNPIRI